MTIYRLKPSGMNHNGFFASVEGAKARAEEVLATYHDLHRTEGWDDPEDYYALAVDLEWEERDVSEHPTLYKQLALAAIYAPPLWGKNSHSSMFIIEEIEVSP